MKVPATLLTVALAGAFNPFGGIPFAPAPLEAQQAPVVLTPLKVGMAAPDFTLTAVSANGTLEKPFRLSEHRGEVVVLAFFPKARTPGCTVQMESYRDRYAKMFNNGEKITLIGISVDPDTALTSWAREARFPFLFGSDESRQVGKLYGASNGTTGAHKRDVYVIDAKGVISYVASPFAQMAETAYTDLGDAVKAALARP